MSVNTDRTHSFIHQLINSTAEQSYSVPGTEHAGRRHSAISAKVPIRETDLTESTPGASTQPTLKLGLSPCDESCAQDCHT